MISKISFQMLRRIILAVSHLFFNISINNHTISIPHTSLMSQNRRSNEKNIPSDLVVGADGILWFVLAVVDYYSRTINFFLILTPLFSIASIYLPAVNSEIFKALSDNDNL